jgi:cob(I)alamin adenosyltransferase
MSIYTKNGDAGETDLYGGKRVRKSVDAVEVLGQFDELNAFLGLSRLLLKKSDAVKISQIQNDLFLLGSIVAGVALKQSDINYLKKRVDGLEEQIDMLERKTTRLASFILPNGCEATARLHLARAICRRCERSLVALGEHMDLVPYLNRLSDYLFVLARQENSRRGVKDELVTPTPR